MPLAVAGLAALGVLLLVMVLLQPAPTLTTDELAQRLAGELRCPDCQALSVAESHTAAADAIRAEIAEQLAAGRSVDEVRQHFVDRYGQWILLQPADPLIWLLPVVVVAIGVGLFAWWLRARPAGEADAGDRETAGSRRMTRLCAPYAKSWRHWMGELLLLVLVAGTVALAVAWPLLDGREPRAEAEPDPEREAARVRHALALEALRDIEADRRAGSLDDEAYRAQRDEAEAHAARTLRALEAVGPNKEPEADDQPLPTRGRHWRLPALVGGVLALLLLAAFAAPPPFGVAQKDARIERIRQLTDTIAANPRDVDALAELADLYLAGATADDVGRALASLVLMRDAAPQSRDANQRLVTLLVRTGLWDDAEAAIDHYSDVVGEDDPDIPFFRGLVARGQGDNEEAVRQFDRFLELAPDDPRAEMIRGLRDDLASEANGG